MSFFNKILCLDGFKTNQFSYVCDLPHSSNASDMRTGSFRFLLLNWASNAVCTPSLCCRAECCMEDTAAPPPAFCLCVVTDPARFLSSRCSSCNLKEVVSQKMKHLAAKPCPRCSLTLQSNIHTHTHLPSTHQTRTQRCNNCQKPWQPCPNAIWPQLTPIILNQLAQDIEWCCCPTPHEEDPYMSVQMEWVRRNRCGWIVKALVVGGGETWRAVPPPFPI